MPIPGTRAPDLDEIYISTKASTVCCIPDFTIEFSRFLIAKKERRVYAFHHVVAGSIAGL